MKEVVIVDYLRSPFSRSRPREPERDAFYPLRADQIAVILLKEVIKRNNIDPRMINEVIVACALGVWEQWTYGGRNIVLLANLPDCIPTFFVDKQCGSSMTAIQHGAMEIMTGYADLTIAIGMEHMTRVPMPPQNKWLSQPEELVTKEEYKHYEMEVGFVMGLTAEKLFKEAAEKHGITKEDMDKWSSRSHWLAAKAQEEGFFKGEILPIEVTYADGSRKVIDSDLVGR